MQTSNIGILLLAIYLILFGLTAIIGLSFNGLGLILAILALVSGICLLIGK